MSPVPNETLALSRTVYRVGDLLGWARRKQLNLRPTYQRGSVWNKKAKSYFIDTVLRGFPVPVIFLQDRTDPRTFEPIRQVVDGQQRLRTVLAFIDPKAVDGYSAEDDFAISRIHNEELKGKTFKDLSDELKQRILAYEFSVHVLPATASNRQVLEVFARMNSTGTKAVPQELRNAMYSGEFKQICYNLGLDWTDEWTRWGIFSRKNLARMDEIEFTSELVIFLLEGLTDKSASRIDATYERYDDDFPAANEVSRRFGTAMSLLAEVYAPAQEEDPMKPFRTRAWFYAIFARASQVLFPQPITPGKKPKPEKLQAPQVKVRLSTLAEKLAIGEVDDALAKALRGASTDKRSRLALESFISAAL